MSGRNGIILHYTYLHGLRRPGSIIMLREFLLCGSLGEFREINGGVDANYDPGLCSKSMST